MYWAYAGKEENVIAQRLNNSLDFGMGTDSENRGYIVGLVFVLNWSVNNQTIKTAAMVQSMDELDKIAMCEVEFLAKLHRQGDEEIEVSFLGLEYIDGSISVAPSIMNFMGLKEGGM